MTTLPACMVPQCHYHLDARQSMNTQCSTVRSGVVQSGAVQCAVQCCSWSISERVGEPEVIIYGARTANRHTDGIDRSSTDLVLVMVFTAVRAETRPTAQHDTTLVAPTTATAAVDDVTAACNEQMMTLTNASLPWAADWLP